jgi:hypothetical protein
VLAFTSVYFSESRLFNGLWADSNKEISAPRTVSQKPQKRRSSLAPLARADPIQGRKRYSTDSDSRKENVWISAGHQSAQFDPQSIAARSVAGQTTLAKAARLCGPLWDRSPAS